ncbi:aldose 1-epimerase family protein [Mycetocola reblochoni]|uniref:aldose 1-epimerase family protein n=1 Tax=Mycetocola reblochoni TaxID=331618 RepID=UPI003F9A0D67
MTGTPLSGRQYDIESGPYTATIASVGASVRRLGYGGRELVRSFAAEQVRPAFSGALLAPWPNRVVDGRYTWDGSEQQLGLTEPDRGHALHGLVAWLDFGLREFTGDGVVLQAVIEPQQGYPHRIAAVVRYRLDDEGLHTELELENTGPSAAPVGWGAHPYLVAPGRHVDDWVLELPASHVQDVSAGRLIPGELVAVEDHPAGLDFRGGRVVASTRIDHAYTGLAPDADGRFVVVVRARDGCGARVVWDERSPWVQVHTADLADSALSRTALAVEPMSCPPGAFGSGTDVVRLEAGERVDASWLIQAVGGA